MRGASIGILLVLALLVFGCTGQASVGGNVSANVSANGSSGGSAGSGAPGSAANNTPQPPPQPPAGTGTNVSSSGGGTATGGTDFSNKGFDGLLALGIPLTCTVTTENGSMQMYMNGKGVTRVEVPATSSESTCNMTVILMQGNKFDMSCAQGSMMGGSGGPFAGCDWLEMTYNASATSGAGSTSSGSSDASSVQKAKPAQFSCQPWVPDASKFATSGNVCNLDQMMKQYAGGGSTGGSYGGYGGYQ